MAEKGIGQEQEGGLRTVGNRAKRRPAEQGRGESEEYWRSLVENIPDIVMTLDRDGTILFVNRTPPGFTVEATIGSIVYDYVPPEHHDTLRKSLQQVFQTQTAEVYCYEIVAPGPFGLTSWYFNRVGPIVQDGRVVAAVLVATDITEHKRAEEALWESEEQYRNLVETTRDVIYTLSTDGVFTSLNSTFETITGWSCAEWVGKPFALILHPDDLPTGTQNFRRILRGEVPPVTELRILTKSGDYLTGEFAARPLIVDGKVVGAFGIARDITERKRAEEALRESEERFRSAFEHAAIGIALVRPDGRLLRVNHSCCEVLGYSEQELASTTWQAVTHPDDLDITQHHVRRVLAGEVDSFQLEKRFVHKLGHVLWGHVTSSLLRDADGRPLYFITQIQDITERKRAEEALRESEEQYRDLVENINEVIYETDASGRITYISPTIEAVGGYSPSDIIDRYFSEFVHPDDLSALVSSFQRGLSGIMEPNDYRIRSKSGEMLWCRSDGRPIFDGDRIVGFRGVLTDITDRKRAEEALRDSEERYRRLVELSPYGILVHSEEKVVFANRTGADLLGAADTDEIMGRSLWDFVHPDNVRAVKKRVQSNRPERKGVDLVEETLIRLDGQVIDVEMAAVPITYGGRPARQVILKDISERKRIEAALQKDREEIESRVERQMQRGSDYGLTFREFTVLHLVVAGRSDKEIGTILGISPLTASKHIANILDKMGASSRTEAGVRAVKEGLLE